MHASWRPRARTTSQKPEPHPNPSRVPPWGDEYGGGTYTRVTTPQSVQSDPQTQTHRRMPRALALPRDVMTTITVNHTFTTTIASPPPPRARWSLPSTSRRRRRGRCAAGGDVDGRHTSTDLATRDRSIARAENTTTDSDSDLDVSTYVTSPTTAFERIRARHCIAFAPRAHSFERARAFVARDERGGDSGVERGGVRESERG